MIVYALVGTLLVWHQATGICPLMTDVKQAQQDTAVAVRELEKCVDQIELFTNVQAGGGGAYTYTGNPFVMGAFRRHQEAHERFVGAVAKLGLIDGALIGVAVAVGACLGKSKRPGLWLCAMTLGVWLQRALSIGSVTYFDRLLKKARHFDRAEFMVVYFLTLATAGLSYAAMDQVLRKIIPFGP